MKLKFLCGAGAVMLLAALAAAQTGPAGHWEGVLTVNNREIVLALDVDRNAKSEWVASMAMPSEGASGLVVMNLEVGSSSVKFVAVELQMARVELNLTPDGKLKGSIASPMGALPIEFKRTGEAKVELIPASPAVSKELEGDWEGTLETPGRPFPLVIHFKNQPGNTVAATIDSPDRNAAGVPLNNVKQDGPAVEFGIRVAHSSFRGTLNKEGTELVGTWTHEADSMPLKLRKK